MNPTRSPWLVSLLAAAATASAAGAQPNFDPAKAVAVDPAVLKQIEAKTAELRAAIGALPEKTAADVRADVEVYLKAAEWAIRHGEFFQKDSPKQTLAVLDAGILRAKAAGEGNTPWREVRGKPVVRGYRSGVDGSVQPYSVTVPEGYGVGGKRWGLDVVLHGRDQTLTEVKFIAGKENAKPVKGADYVVLEPYGRGNNACRWAGETDVFEAVESFGFGEAGLTERLPFAPSGVVLRGFSMGGAGAWHIGLHHPLRFSVVGPGAGFTTTRGYIKNLPAKLPEYQEACLHIYDAVDYAENAFNVPVVAYSGANDPQKAAADNIENALKGFKLPLRFTHLVATGLQHQMPAEWQAKAEAEYRRVMADRTTRPEHVRFVTYTTRFNNSDGWFTVEGLDRHYERAIVDGRWDKQGMVLVTSNIRAIDLSAGAEMLPPSARVDGQDVKLSSEGLGDKSRMVALVKRDGRWAAEGIGTRGLAVRGRPDKTSGLQGPIDDAFMDSFAVVAPTGKGWSEPADAYAAANQTRFEAEWDKFFRGRLRTLKPEATLLERNEAGHLILFGDPASNPLIAKVVAKLPITWTRDKLVVNGVGYDPKTHVPVLIYPNPLNPSKYVVINSGHTFHAADLNGTNALLYPRLGDWAVLKPTPTEKDPAAAEVVAAGLFDEFWQFPKK